MSDISKGVALVTGASSGIGATYAEKLAGRGYDLILTGRDETRLKTLAERLVAKTGRKVEVLKADLTSRADLAKVEDRLANDAAVTLLVNNAGMSLNGSLLDNEPAALEKIIALNITAPTLLAAAAGKAFVARGRGAIVNIASVLAVAPEMFDGVYSGSKAHLLNLTLSLAQKLEGTGVHAQVVLPGATRTEIWERSGKSVDALPVEWVMEVDDLVDAALVGLDKGEIVTIPPLADEGQWVRYEEARLALAPNLSSRSVAARYRVAQAA
jgi:short-subunit dehydrogenase